MENDIKICPNHQEYQVPLIWTFAFSGAEFWCPYCGYKSGVLGAGKYIPSTPELQERHRRYKIYSDEYLHAVGIQICVSTMWEGTRIPPHELPQAEKERLHKVIMDWKSNVKIENVNA
jgi:hypothetical protein